MRTILENGDRAQVFASRDVAQREGLAHHVGQARGHRVNVLDERVAQAAFEQRGAQRRRAHGHQRGSGGVGQAHEGVLRLKPGSVVPRRAVFQSRDGMAARLVAVARGLLFVASSKSVM
jgi:hypothetical protein